MRKLGPYELNKVHHGYVPEALRQLPENSVHTCISSPPYWNLRVYEDLEPQIWGGDIDCKHEWAEQARQRRSSDGIVENGMQAHNVGSLGRDEPLRDAFCTRCGAWRGFLGLEPSPSMYVDHLVEIFREVRRVLRKDGTLWLNLGDCYIGHWGKKYAHRPFGEDRTPDASTPPNKITIDFKKENLKPKDMAGIPWRVALALQADGWWLRQDVVWRKPSPMPESVNGWRWEQHRIRVGNDEHGRGIYEDCPGCEKCISNDGLVLKRGSGRCTRAHEYVFLLAKSSKYFYDVQAISEEASTNTHPRGSGRNPKSTWPSGWDSTSGSHQRLVGRYPRPRQNESFSSAVNEVVQRRNKRSVWTVNSDPCPEAHFATFPADLVNPMILAGTSEKGCCPECGLPWARVIDVERSERDDRGRTHGLAEQRMGKTPPPERGWEAPVRTRGFRPSCRCWEAKERPSRFPKFSNGWLGDNEHAIPQKAVVLDPFAGTGTTIAEAIQHGRAAIGFDGSRKYVTDFAAVKVRTARTGLSKADQEAGQASLFDLGEEA